MRIPGFAAAASLRTPPRDYRERNLYGASPAAEILPALLSTGTSGLYGPAAPCPRPWEKRVWCCEPAWPGSRPSCTYSCVPLWWQCTEIFTPYSCWTCRPPGVLTATAGATAGGRAT